MLERFDETDCKCGLPVEIQADCVKLRDRVTQLEGELKRYAGCGHDHSTAWWQLRCEDTENDKVILQRHLQESAEQLGKLQADHARVLGLVRALPVAERKVRVKAEGIFRARLAAKMVGVGDEMALSGTPELIKLIADLLKYRASLPAQPAQGGE